MTKMNKSLNFAHYCSCSVITVVLLLKLSLVKQAYCCGYE